MIFNTSPSMRLFYALWPDDPTRAALQALQTHVAGRHVGYANLHITLAFLGEQPAACVPALKEVLRQLPRAPIALQIDRLAYFNQSRIAWAGMHETPAALTQLQSTLTHTLLKMGFSVDQRRFTPHVTLARDADVPNDCAFDPIAWQANEIALVHSLQAGGNLAYRVLAAQRLQDTA